MYMPLSSLCNYEVKLQNNNTVTKASIIYRCSSGHVSQYPKIDKTDSCKIYCVKCNE